MNHLRQTQSQQRHALQVSQQVQQQQQAQSTALVARSGVLASGHVARAGARAVTVTPPGPRCAVMAAAAGGTPRRPQAPQQVTD